MKHTPVSFAILASRRGYLVSLCISMGMISFNCSLRHCGLLSASYNTKHKTFHFPKDILRLKRISHFGKIRLGQQ